MVSPKEKNCAFKEPTDNQPTISAAKAGAGTPF
jgi:hypothetical protein